MSVKYFLNIFDISEMFLSSALNMLQEICNYNKINLTLKMSKIL